LHAVPAAVGKPMKAPPNESHPKGTGRYRRSQERRLHLSDREVITHGLPRRAFQDIYHYCMTISWTQLILTLAGLSLLFNLAFASVYHLQPDCIANLNPPGFAGAFFFSVETLATVGYGDMHPQTEYGHTVAAVEVFVGLVSIALVTGVMFARFSRPTARFLFANYAVVRPVDGRLTLMFRAANARQNVIMEASAQLRIIQDAVTSEGYRIRRVADLPLVRSQHPLFVLGWNLMHVIDEGSPLRAATAATLKNSRSVFSLTLSGTDETTGQVLMGRKEFRHDAIRWNHSFVDVLTSDSAGVDHFNYERFHDVEPFDSEPDGRT
jgi:inward rectifier potassium channel